MAGDIYIYILIKKMYILSHTSLSDVNRGQVIYIYIYIYIYHVNYERSRFSTENLPPLVVEIP